MKLSSLLIICLLGLGLVPTTSSQSNSPQAPVEISGEAHHHPKLENEFVRIWDVTVPAGEATLWHVHRNDNVVVTFADANLRLESATSAPAEAQWKFGEVRFAKATYVHRALNVGTTPFHNLTIELLKSPGPQAQSPKYPITRTPALENERVRVFRVTLEPGQSTSMHTHVFAGLSIALTSGEIEITTEGKKQADKLSLPLGDVRWRASSVTHSVKNVGKTRFEAVDVELK
jgi:quercetin dioxygenase-like cupin family protein